MNWNERRSLARPPRPCASSRAGKSTRGNEDDPETRERLRPVYVSGRLPVLQKPSGERVRLSNGLLPSAAYLLEKRHELRRERVAVEAQRAVAVEGGAEVVRGVAQQAVGVAGKHGLRVARASAQQEGLSRRLRVQDSGQEPLRR